MININCHHLVITIIILITIIIIIFAIIAMIISVIIVIILINIIVIIIIIIITIIVIVDIIIVINIIIIIIIDNKDYIFEGNNQMKCCISCYILQTVLYLLMMMFDCMLIFVIFIQLMYN